MLILTRKAGERILIGSDVVLTVTRIQGQTIRLGVEAPQTVSIARAELVGRVEHLPRPESTPTQN